MNNVKLLHIKCCFFQFFNSPVTLKNLKKFRLPQEKIEMTPLVYCNNEYSLTNKQIKSNRANVALIAHGLKRFRIII